MYGMVLVILPQTEVVNFDLDSQRCIVTIHHPSLNILGLCQQTT